jgi:hypothetical protein
VVLEEAGGRAEQDAVQEARLQRGGLAGWSQVGQGGLDGVLGMGGGGGHAVLAGVWI